MNEQSKKWVIGLIVAVIFVVCMALVIVGQRNIEVSGLAMQMTGFVGILVLLYLYNRKYQ